MALGEALQPSFKTYIDNVLANAKALGEVLKAGGVDLVTGGTDNHLLLVDLRPKGLKGNQVEHALERADITCNKNGIPFDPEKPTQACVSARRPAPRVVLAWQSSVTSVA